ncbi:MAG: hypothetical protein AAF587_44825, partial [Bacteroidota bacterium]
MWKEIQKGYEEDMSKRLNAQATIPNKTLRNVHKSVLFDLEVEDDEFLQEYRRVINDPSLPHEEEVTKVHEPIDPDNYVNMIIGLPRGEDNELHRATVKRRATDDEGKPLGLANSNPLLDSQKYEVEFSNGELEIMAANILAENILAQVDKEGYKQVLLDKITDHRVLKDAIPRNKGTFKTPSGATRKKRTTCGWDLLVSWKGGSSEWVALKDLKDSYPIELAQYARDNDLMEEPVFAWWAPWTLKKATRIIAKIKSKYWQRTHKYGIEIPKTINDAKRIDHSNGDTLWMDAVRLEMRNCRIAFEEHQGDMAELDNYQEITGHLVFDVKLGENFRRKARFCADGNKTEAPAAVTYSSVVSRDSVRLLLLIAALNDLPILSA